MGADAGAGGILALAGTPALLFVAGWCHCPAEVQALASTCRALRDSLHDPLWEPELQASLVAVRVRHARSSSRTTASMKRTQLSARSATHLVHLLGSGENGGSELLWWPEPEAEILAWLVEWAAGSGHGDVLAWLLALDTFQAAQRLAAGACSAPADASWLRRPWSGLVRVPG